MPKQTPKPSPEPAPAALMHHRTRHTPAKRHGGAWKVAYADFVTALMALFIVLWMMSASDRVKKSVAGYFHDPRGYTQRLGAGPAGAGEGLAIGKGQINRLQEEIEQALHRVPDFKGLQENVKVSATGEGLRIDLLETEQGLFFIPAGPEPTPEGERLLEALAAQIRLMPNPVVIEGHTDARPFRNGERYGNWELSTERANAARRLLQRSGVRSDQVVEVRGFADHRLLKPSDPNDASNRRISLVLRFSE